MTSFRFCASPLHCRIMTAVPQTFVLSLIIAFGLLFHPRDARADEMQFRLVSIGGPSQCGSSCPVVIAAEGEITNETPSRFISFVQSNIGERNLHAIVFLDSPGGRVLASMELGRVLRRIGAAAIVGRVDPYASHGVSEFAAARCLSACVYALIGAKKRVIPPESLVGIHRMFAYVDAVDQAGEMGQYRAYDNGEMAAVLSRYTGMMGVSPALIRMAEHISSDRIHIMTRREIARFRLGSSRF